MPESALIWGPLSDRTVHLCVDMQNVFAEDTPWRTPWMKRVLPFVAEIAGRHARRTIFTRFMPPSEPSDAIGTWRRYFQRWEELTLKRADPWLFELVEPLQRLVPPARVLDKPFYSPFHGTDLAASLRAAGCDTLVISGAETDLCVLAAVLDAVDVGLRVVLPVDALCSSSDEMHDALLALYGNRFSQQVETIDTETLLSSWR
jgi:nicotinamidase-related amidase